MQVDLVDGLACFNSFNDGANAVYGVLLSFDGFIIWGEGKKKPPNWVVFSSVEYRLVLVSDV
ncbi:MAG: hypothetical protein ACO30S_06370, partial [Flavobacteriaceae bacterium]